MVKLEVGKKYRNREGDIMTIVGYYGDGPHDTQPFRDNENSYYSEDGYYWYDKDECEYDLVEEVKEIIDEGIDYNDIVRQIIFDHEYYSGLELMEEEEMDLTKINKKNLKEAKKQYEAEKANAEIEYAKKQLRYYSDQVDRVNREIKDLEEERQGYEEKLSVFK